MNKELASYNLKKKGEQYQRGTRGESKEARTQIYVIVSLMVDKIQYINFIKIIIWWDRRLACPLID
jgi:hypothetical protein